MTQVQRVVIGESVHVELNGLQAGAVCNSQSSITPLLNSGGSSCSEAASANGNTLQLIHLLDGEYADTL